jgi:hypothetical protein
LGILGPQVPLALLQMSQDPSALRALKEQPRQWQGLLAQLGLQALLVQPGLKAHRAFRAYRVFKVLRAA